MLIYIYDIFSTNMGEITVYEALLEGVSAYAEHVTVFCCIFRKEWSNVWTLLFLKKLKW